MHATSEWGFELEHNDGPHEALDAGMLTVLQEGFARAARANAGNVWPCGAEAAYDSATISSFDLAPQNSTVAAKALTLRQATPTRFAPPELLRRTPPDAHALQLY